MRTQKEDQFEPGKPRKSLPTSKSKQGQAATEPEEEVVNNRIARKGKEEVVPETRGLILSDNTIQEIWGRFPPFRQNPKKPLNVFASDPQSSDVAQDNNAFFSSLNSG
ncbi:hypothetical protein TNCV_3136941 [Trichonephila clavipes]|nr:hypothetical protein TNCV_3136941 [Trichonephila clavipes]